MALTAREWLLLSEDEQEHRKNELSSHECFLLRTNLEYMRITEDEKKNMSQSEREAFLHPREYTEEEKAAFNEQCREIFKQMQDEADRKKNSTSQ